MKKYILVILSVLLISLMAGCDLFPQGDAAATAVAGTLESMHAVETAVAGTQQSANAIYTAVAQTVAAQDTTSTEEPGPDVLHLETQCGHFSVFISPAIASGSTCETLPEANEADMPYFGIWPQHDELTLTGYATGAKFHTPRVYVYPIARYSELIPDGVPPIITRMQDLLAGTPLDGGVPFLPFFGAAQVFHGKVQRIDTPALSGYRFITTYSQWAVPINNNELFYTFQGITSDGLYWVSVVLPVTNAFLPETDAVPDGDFSAWSNGYTVYLNDLVPQLNVLADDSFFPTLTALDELVSSIVVTP